MEVCNPKSILQTACGAIMDRVDYKEYGSKDQSTQRM